MLERLNWESVRVTRNVCKGSGALTVVETIEDREGNLLAFSGEATEAVEGIEEPEGLVLAWLGLRRYARLSEEEEWPSSYQAEPDSKSCLSEAARRGEEGEVEGNRREASRTDRE